MTVFVIQILIFFCATYKLYAHLFVIIFNAIVISKRVLVKCIHRAKLRLKEIVAHLLMKIPVYYGTRKFITLFTTDRRSQWPSGLKAWVCSRSPAGIAGSNPAKGMDVCIL